MAGVLLVFQYMDYRGALYRCGEIRLRDDGPCEFEAKRRTIHLHVAQIRSVKFSLIRDESDESYTIHYDGGKIDVSSKMTDFRDFLIRLKALNPAVDLTSFPAKAWPEVAETPTKKGAVGLGLRSAIFLLFVIALLVFLTIETFVRN